VYEANEGGRGGGRGRDRTSGPDRITYFSQRPNTDNELFAPGAVIESTVPGGGTRGLSGTSMASPLVAGVVALMQEAAQRFGGRLLSPAEVKSILRDTADQIVDGDDEDTTVRTTGGTYRRVNAYKALQFIQAEFTGQPNPGNPGTPPPAGVDPNGTIENAILGPTLAGADVEPVGGNIGADGTTDVGGNDVDLYRFVVTSPGTVTLGLTNTEFAPVLRVFDAAGAEVGAGTTSVAGPLAAGTYYVGVSGSPNSTYNPTVAGSGPDGGTGNYDLSFALGTADPDGVLAGAVAINLTSGAESQALNAVIGADADLAVGGGDVDIYQVTVPDDGNLLVDIDTLTSDVADTFVRVFDADGTQLLVSDDDLATGITGAPIEFDPVPGVSNLGDVVTAAPGGGEPAGHDTDSFVNVPATRGATYFIAVCNFANRNFNPGTLTDRVATGSTGEYSLFVSLKSRDFNGAIPQAIAAEALPIERSPGDIGSDGTPDGAVAVGDRDVDFVRIDASTAGILELRVDSDGDPEVSDSVDTVIRLFDEAGTLLALNDDGGSGVDPVLRYEVSAGTTYYAAVAGYGNDGFDPFVLGSGGSGSTGEYFFSADVLPLSQADRAGRRHRGCRAGSGAGARRVGDRAGRGGRGVRPGRGGRGHLHVHRPVRRPVHVHHPAGRRLRGRHVPAAVRPGRHPARPGRRRGRRGDRRQPDRGRPGGRPDVPRRRERGRPGRGRVQPDHRGRGGRRRHRRVHAGGRVRAAGGHVRRAGAGRVHGRRRVAGDDLAVRPRHRHRLLRRRGNADPAGVMLEGTTEASTLTVKGATTIRTLTVDGALKALSAKTTNLAGNLAATGTIRSLALADVTDAVITLGAGGPVSITARNVFDASIDSGAPIKSLKVAAWADTGGPDDVVTAPAVSAVSAGGDLGASIVAGSIGKVTAGGQLNGDVRSDGNIDAVTARTIGAVRVFAGVRPDVTTLPDEVGDFANPQAVLKSLSVKGRFAGSFGPAAVAAPTINKAAVGFLDTSNDGAVFGLAADLVKSLSGNFDGFTKFKFRSLADPSQSVAEGDAVVRIV
jgi:hypothetical protein